MARSKSARDSTTHDVSRLWCSTIASFFFFQAEDGIRDYKVTGVQTCALPISMDPDTLMQDSNDTRHFVIAIDFGTTFSSVAYVGYYSASQRPRIGLQQIDIEIGRASCRERV